MGRREHRKQEIWSEDSVGRITIFIWRSARRKNPVPLDSAQRQARFMPVPDDWCYVYNFEDSNRPSAINLPAGMGRIQKDMEDFVKVIEQEISKPLTGMNMKKNAPAL